MIVEIVNKSKHELPKYATSGSAGFDIKANINEDVVLKPNARALIPTGLYIALPELYELRIQSRSGLAIKNGIIVLNSPGCVDSDYRGEIGVIIMNLGYEDFTIHDGDKIAQGILSRVVNADFLEVEMLDITERGEGGFGHSGI